MATRNKSDDDGLIADINVTPLVDITLVLLIIFMVAAPMVLNQAIKVDLPKAASGKAEGSTPVAITIREGGAVYLNGNATTRGDLETFLREKVKAKAEVRAILSADAKVSHGTVVSYLDLLNQLGITKYAVSVERPPAQVASRGAGS